MVSVSVKSDRFNFKSKIKWNQIKSNQFTVESKQTFSKKKKSYSTSNMQSCTSGNDSRLLVKVNSIVDKSLHDFRLIRLYANISKIKLSEIKRVFVLTNVAINNGDQPSWTKFTFAWHRIKNLTTSTFRCFHTKQNKTLNFQNHKSQKKKLHLQNITALDQSPWRRFQHKIWQLPTDHSNQIFLSDNFAFALQHFFFWKKTSIINNQYQISYCTGRQKGRIAIFGPMSEIRPFCEKQLDNFQTTMLQ